LLNSIETGARTAEKSSTKYYVKFDTNIENPR